MPECDQCGEQCIHQFFCSYCGGTYCSDHRFPPSHNCVNEAAWKNRTAGSTKHSGSNSSSDSGSMGIVRHCPYCKEIINKDRIYSETLSNGEFWIRCRACNGAIDEIHGRIVRYRKPKIYFREQNRISKIFRDEKERLIYTEEKFRFSDSSKLPEKEIDESSNLLVSEELFLKKCENCPDHKNYVKWEIHECPDCGKWFCDRHFQGHIMKNHKSSEYTVSGYIDGHALYKTR